MQLVHSSSHTKLMTHVFFISVLSARLHVSKSIDSFLQVHFRYSVYKKNITQIFHLMLKVDAMKLGLKEMKKEYKKVNIDEIEVCLGLL